MSLDYVEIGLNNQLFRVGSPYAKRLGTSAFDFDAANERASINNRLLQDQSINDAKIDSLNANKITAGSIDAGVINVTNIDANNITSGTINAGTIDVTDLNADNITSGSIDASSITVYSLDGVTNAGGVTVIDGNKITTGTVDASVVVVDNIDADKITVGELDASGVPIENLDGVTNSSGVTIIDGGKITTGTIDASVVEVDNIDANNINSGTITGILFRTDSSGDRVEITNSAMNFYGAGGTAVASLWAGAGNIITLDEIGSDKAITLQCTNDITLNSFSRDITLNANSDIDIGGRLDLGDNSIVDVNTINGGGNDVKFGDSIDMEDNNLNDVNAINVDYIDDNDNSQVQVNSDLYVNGALSKNSGTFDIPHPDPKKKDLRLRHSFVEAPTAGENVYRYEVDVAGGVAEIDLPDYFKHLNENPQVWVSPVDVFGIAKATSTLEKVSIEADTDGKYNVLVIGTRADPLGVSHWNKYGLEYVNDERFKNTVHTKKEKKLENERLEKIRLLEEAREMLKGGETTDEIERTTTIR